MPLLATRSVPFSVLSTPPPIRTAVPTKTLGQTPEYTIQPDQIIKPRKSHESAQSPLSLQSLYFARQAGIWDESRGRYNLVCKAVSPQNQFPEPT